MGCTRKAAPRTSGQCCHCFLTADPKPFPMENALEVEYDIIQALIDARNKQTEIKQTNEILKAHGVNRIIVRKKWLDEVL